jgi:hypothetical protein
MIPDIRKRYNALFTDAAYAAYVHDLNTLLPYPADFKVCETPLFVSPEMKQEMIKAASAIIAELQTDEYKARSGAAIPPGAHVPNETPHPEMLQIDFAICSDGNGGFTPRLIELQGFPSLYCFQAFLDDVTRKHFWIPDGFSPYFGGLDRQGYIDHLKAVISGDSAPEHTILMEVDPPNQKTRIDFAATEQMLGIRAVDIREVVKRGRKLFYKCDGVETPIERIYSRFIRDDPKFAEMAATSGNLWLDQEIDAVWITHPNWYYKISKYSLPLIRSAYAPQAHFLHELDAYPADLENYVLKPLFLYSGAGIELDVTRERLDAITQRDNYLLQRKVQYAPLIETPDGYAYAEVRLLFTWAGDQPRLVCNLVRMSKGKMMGVRFNRDKTWVGSSVAYFPVDEA